ncbi:MAG: glycosyl hydrolase family 2 [Prevotella sp.]|nr:glycosyl hydrolase family 2 [Prevotella sp.]
MRRLLICISCLVGALSAHAQAWPQPQPEAKAGTRWWWLGSAVDHDNLQWSLREYANKGIGAVEITPLYGVQGNEQRELLFLSPAWMAALSDVEALAADNGIEVDMNCGTGWPFGGPEVPLEEAACKAVFVDTVVHAKHVDASKIALPAPEKERPYAQLQCIRAFPTGETDTWRVIAVYASRTRQRVKRAAPGGEGWVIDHFDRLAVRHYLDRFERAFASSAAKYPHTFFNDSYEVYRANWTPTLFDEFFKRRGYRLEDHLPQLLGFEDDGNAVLSDYRETLSDLLYENFTLQWVAWSHEHGVQVRNQAHGSPANLLDIYAAVDIPEIEGFGLSEFGIKGLRADSGMTRRNFSDVSMLKYASSAAHVTGKRLTSSETFTWLTEHFRTSLSQMKPDLDLMFTCGVNHVYFHGTCYSPRCEAWPGWKFYASVDFSPTNSIWRDANGLLKYIERSQSYLQTGEPDNDFLVYLPVKDMWKQRGPRNDDDKSASWNRRKGEDLLMQFDIHTMGEKAPLFIKSILAIDSLGYDCDYISERQLAKVSLIGGRLVTEGGATYKALIIPSGTSAEEIARLQRRISGFQTLTPYIIYGEQAEDLARFAKPEPMKTAFHLRAMRRKNQAGHFYFIANLTPDDVEACVPLAVEGRRAAWFNPMDGDIARAEFAEGKLRLALRSGESRILQVYNDDYQSAEPEPDSAKPEKDNRTDGGQTPTVHAEKDLTPGAWTLSFTEEAPRVERTFRLNGLQTWETLDDDSARVTMGTGIYTTHVRLNRREAARRWRLELGDVRESARVFVNGTPVGCAWAVPFTLDCRNLLRKGKNEIRIEVTNLPANRIADMDRRNVPWRKFKEINFVDIDYQKTTYGHWKPVPSGLASTVKLVADE